MRCPRDSKPPDQVLGRFRLWRRDGQGKAEMGVQGADYSWSKQRHDAEEEEGSDE
jgi:hypothetical protein